MKPTKRNETKHECCRGLSDPLSSFLLGGFENEKVRNDASGLEGRGDASERRRLIIALSQRLSSAVPQFRSSARSCAPQARKGAPIFCRACARRAAGDGVCRGSAGPLEGRRRRMCSVFGSSAPPPLQRTPLGLRLSISVHLSICRHQSIASVASTVVCR
jgi:hypothetical protein